ncbi:MAG: VOC family protein [Thermoflexales bacterium]|nr:VOC family protein [Thermoflexales bacterium]
MLNHISLITILTDDVPRLAAFYREALGFAIKQDMGGYVEFENSGVRFAICARSVLHQASGDASYTETRRGHAFELAFPCDSPADVDRAYADILTKGATPVHAPADMPWGQRTAMFADPDGNIHELFADLPQN